MNKAPASCAHERSIWWPRRMVALPCLALITIRACYPSSYTPPHTHNHTHTTLQVQYIVCRELDTCPNTPLDDAIATDRQYRPPCRCL